MAQRDTKSSSDEVGLDPNAWMLTFGDLVTLLLTFFVLLLTMSSMDEKDLREVTGLVFTPPDLIAGGGQGGFVAPPMIVPMFRVDGPRTG